MRRRAGSGQKHNFAAATRCIHGGFDEGVAADGKDNGICTAAIRFGQNAFYDIFAAGMNWIFEAVAGGDCVALGVEVGSEDTGAGAAGKNRVHQTDGPLTDDQDRVIGDEIEHFYALENSVDWLEKGSLLEWDAVGDGNDSATGGDPVHHANILREAAAGRLEASRYAYFFVEGALCWGSLAAIEALAAGYMMVNDNPLATVKPGYARADADNGARHFMTENAGGGVGAGVNLL